MGLPRQGTRRAASCGPGGGEAGQRQRCWMWGARHLAGGFLPVGERTPAVRERWSSPQEGARSLRMPALPEAGRVVGDPGGDGFSLAEVGHEDVSLRRVRQELSRKRLGVSNSIEHRPRPETLSLGARTECVGYTI